MLEVTRLNGSIYYLNPDMMMFVEATPDTVITLTSGDKVMVKETPQQLRDQFMALKQEMFSRGFTTK